ncbi:MAG: porin [Neptuniibacter sp.]
MKNNKQLKNGHNRITSLKQTAVAVALSSVASVASADIVIGSTDTTTLSMFGLLDIGVLYQDHYDAANGETVGIESNGLTPSVIGFKGVRELPGNTNAFFNLESHFAFNNGEFIGGEKLFRRQANLGLTGDWGTVIAGRQYGPALLAQLGTEPRGYKEQFSQVFTLVYSTIPGGASGAGDAANENNDVGIFFSDAIQYRNSINGFDFGLMYSAAGTAENSDGDVVAVGLAYNNGPLTLSTSYQSMDDDVTGEEVIKNWSLGAAYNFGDITVKANYLATENKDDDGSMLVDLESLGVGLDWRWDPRNTATVAYYNNEAKGEGDVNTLVLSNDYKLDSQTTVYAQLAHVDADNVGDDAQFATSVVATPTPADQKTTLINVGFNIAF